MDTSNFRGKKKFLARKDIPTKTVINERFDEEWNEDSSQEEFEFESNKLPLESIPEPDYDEEELLLSWYDSDLNLVIDENFTAASPLQQRGFSYLQAGARATFGFFSGKVFFEVKVLQCGKVSSRQGHLNTHLLRVGWSPRKSSLALGSDHKSYGYDSAGRISTLGEIVDYGKPFSTGDVVGAHMDAGDDVVTISFTLNGEDMGMAYQIPQSVIQKEPLFPHILTKNISYECNFGKEKPWFPPKEGYTYVADVSKVSRIAGPRRPKSQSDCEVILMVGLPKSGKTTWVNEFREKHPGMYYVIDPHTLVDRMELMDPERRSIILSRTKLLGKLLGIAMDRRRNYILDQVNVGWAEQCWKLGYFRNHKRRIVAIVIPDEELKKRTRKLDDNDLDWMYILKAKFRLPIMACRQISEVADTVEYVGLPLNRALPLVKFYNREAWRLGYKNKKFWIPAQVFKDKRKITEGDWMPPEMNDPREADFHGGGGWGSPPRERGGEEWFPPPRDRGDEGWQSPPRARDNREWCSPSGQRMAGGDWPPSRRRSPGMWPPHERDRPGGMSGSPPRGQPDEGWPPGPRKRRYSESPPRRRPGTRWGPPVEERNLPQGREEEWQPQRARSPGPRHSPPRRRPDSAARYPGRHSPPRTRTEEVDFGRNRVHAEDPADWNANRGARPMQETPDREGWIGPGPERSGRFPPEEARDRSGAFPRDLQIEGNFPPERRGDSGMLPHGSRGRSSLPPEEAEFGGRFSHRGGITHGRSRSPPPRRMDNEFPFEEDRFSNKMSHTKERVGDMMHSREVRIDTDFLPQDQRMGGTFPRKDSGFPPQDIHFETERIVYEERGNMPPLEVKMGRGMSPHSRKGNDFPTPERRTGGLSVRDRLGAKLDEMPPRGVRPARSLSPRERMTGNVLPSDGRMPSDTRLFDPEMGDFPPHEGRFDEIPPHVSRMRDDRMRDDRMGPIGRSGGNTFPHENRRDDTRSVRMIGNLPPQERRMGDMPPHEDRMGGDFSHREGRPGDLPPHRSRRSGEFGPDERGYQFPQHEQPGVNLLHHEGRMGSDVLPREIRSADFPFQEGRIDHGDLHRGREMADMPRGGRMGGDMPIGVEVGGEMTGHRSRLVDEGPSGGSRSSGNDVPRGRKGEEFPPNRGRIDADLPLRGRGSSGEFLPPRDRIGSDRPPHRERIGGDMEPHGGRHGDLPPLEGRHGGDMPVPGGTSFSDAPLFGGRHDEFPSHGGRPGNDKPHHGRPGDDLPPGGRVYGGDFASHGGRIGDVPPSGRRIGGDKVQEVGMLDDPREARGSSSDRWNRLPADREDPRNFEWMSTQDLDPNSRNVKNRPGGGVQLHPHGRSEGGGPPGDWKPLDDRMPDRPPQPMQQLHRLDNRDNENNINRFHDKRVSPSRAPQKWPSPNRARRPASPSPNRPRRQSLSPVRRSRFDDQGPRQNVEQAGGRRVSPRRPAGGRQSPLGRSDRSSPEGRRAGRQPSPGRGGVGGGGGGGWRPPGDRQGGDWQMMERGNRGGPNDRLPPNVDRGRHSPPRKQQRLEADLGDRPSRPFPEGLDSRDQQGPGFQLMGNPDKKLEPADRDLRDRMMSGPESHGAPFIPSGPSGPGGPFLGKEDAVKEPAGGWQGVHGAPHKGWQSSGGGGGGSRWERGPEEEEELAPYEIPFNQADWDSNDPIAGIHDPPSKYREHQMRPPDVAPVDERNKESSGSRNQEARGHPDSKGRSSVWQRVGGYVNDEKESSKRGSGSRGPSRYSDHSSRGERGHRGADGDRGHRGSDSERGRRGSDGERGHRGSDGERGHRGSERSNKDRERDFESSRVRRGRDK